jgi:3-methylcrotonyl-CoA carboxylase alpha subunit
MKYHAS